MIVKLVARPAGNKIRQNIYIGADEDHLQHAGALVLEVPEWQLFGVALTLGTQQLAGQVVLINMAHFTPPEDDADPPFLPGASR